VDLEQTAYALDSTTIDLCLNLFPLVRFRATISVYVLVAIVKKELGVQRSRYEILRVFSLALFEKTPLLQALQAEWSASEQDADRNQLRLFEL